MFLVTLSDKPEMKHLLTADSEAFVSYLADIFEKLNMLNNHLQATSKTLILLQKNYVKNMFPTIKFDQFPWGKNVRRIMLLCESFDNIICL